MTRRRARRRAARGLQRRPADHGGLPPDQGEANKAGAIRAGGCRPVQPAGDPALPARRQRRPGAGHRRRRVLRAAPGHAAGRPAGGMEQAPGRYLTARPPSGPPARTPRCSSRAYSSPTRCGEFRDQEFAPSGVVAGVMARTDATRGVWKAPAGLEATLVGVSDLTVPLTDPENGRLNPRRHQLPADQAGCRTGRVGRPHAPGRRPAGLRVEVHPRAPHSPCSSRRACTGAPSGWSSSPTTSRCGPRSG